MKKRLLAIYIIMCTALSVGAQNDSVLVQSNSNPENVSAEPVKLYDSLTQPDPNGKGCWFGNACKSVFGFFTAEPDTMFIEPQRYNFTLMAQTTITDDYFSLQGDDGHVVSFAPSRKLKLGPFFGWRWLFFGYVFNINTINLSSNNFDINTTIYTPAIGLDLIYRKLGDGYSLRSMQLGDFDATEAVKGMDADGLEIDVMSVNAYYVLNKRKYSHQAAFNQTNRQLINAGSWIIGTGYNQCSVEMDWKAFKNKLKKRTNGDERYIINDSALVFNKIGYRSIPLTAGYGYNWVFAKNWLFGAQMLGSLSYMWSQGDAYDRSLSIRDMINDFKFKNFTFDGTIRLGLVWNNAKWFAGASAIYHTYHYHQNKLQADNIFGQVNVYVGYNFWRKK